MSSATLDDHDAGEVGRRLAVRTWANQPVAIPVSGAGRLYRRRRHASQAVCPSAPGVWGDDIAKRHAGSTIGDVLDTTGPPRGAAGPSRRLWVVERGEWLAQGGDVE